MTTVEIYIKELDRDAIFTGWVKREEAAFSYSYGSISGVARKGEYEYMVEDIDWNKKEFTDEENKLIENKYWKKAWNELIDQYVKVREELAEY